MIAQCVKWPTDWTFAASRLTAHRVAQHECSKNAVARDRASPDCATLAHDRQAARRCSRRLALLSFATVPRSPAATGGMSQ